MVGSNLFHGPLCPEGQGPWTLYTNRSSGIYLGTRWLRIQSRTQAGSLCYIGLLRIERYPKVILTALPRTHSDDATESNIGFQPVSFAPANDAFQAVDCAAGVVTVTCRRFVLWGIQMVIGRRIFSIYNHRKKMFK
jgi:hypothetical protein